MIRHRAALLASERSAASDMVRVYGASWNRLSRQIDALQREMAAESPVPTMVQIMRDARLRAMQAQIEGEFARFAPYASSSVTALQRSAVGMAERNAVDAITAASDTAVLARLTRMNPGAVEAIVGFASDGSPLRELFDAIGLDVTPRMIEALSHGIALGTGARVIAREMRAQFGIGLTRSLTIARTETMRAYREATHATYEANSDVINGWIWMASITIRSCPACIAMHGTLHDLREKLNGHPNCRCVAAPHVAGTSVTVVSGESRFADMADEDKRRILGPSRYAAYQDGNLDMNPYGLRSIVGTRYDPRWGSTTYAKPLGGILSPDEAKQYTTRA